VDLKGRSALVTGGAGGLGAATVRHLVGVGMGVAIFDRDGKRAAELAKELGPGAVGVAGDVTDDDDVTAAVEAARTLGVFSLVANVAGGATGGGRTVGKDGKLHDKGVFVSTMAMNAVGTFNVSRIAAAAMAKNEPDEHGQRGVIVNTSSIAGIEGQTGQVAYSAAKGAILGMTLPMARDLGALGVRVCAIAPGTMGTPLMMMVPEAMRQKLTENIVFPHRMGRPEEFALLVESIARNPYLNGENIRLDGALRFPPK
jgi:NAD(P)-dependent dehydrogenase (short-subunit alcohol dehydrogenase family)